MLKTLAQIVCSIAVFCAYVNAKEIPIVKQITIIVPIKEFSVIEFPFEIKSHDFTPFVSLAKKDDMLDPMSAPSFTMPALNGATTPPSAINPSSLDVKKKVEPMDVSKGKNFIKLYPRKVGSTELLVWGYSKFPLMIKLEVTDDKAKADKLIKFIDYDEQKDEAINYESTPHDKVIISITKALYNDQLPKGYMLKTSQRESSSGTLGFILIKEFEGKRYAGQEYLVTNNGTQNIALDADIFSGQKGFYSITFTHEILEPKMKTRLFIVKQRDGEPNEDQ